MYMNNFLKTVRLNPLISTLSRSSKKFLSNDSAVVVGCYQTEGEDGKFNLTNNGEYVDEKIGSKLTHLLNISKFKAEVGKTRTFFGLHDDYPCITVTGLGSKSIEYDPNEEMDERKENIRTAISAATKSLKSSHFNSMQIDSCGDAAAAAEGSFLSLHTYDDLKSKKVDEIDVNVFNPSENDVSNWNTGKAFSGGQNYARYLMETPSNYKPPLQFADMVAEAFSKYPNIDVKIRDEEWAKEKNMNCFLSVGQGSTNRSAFLELHYKRSDAQQMVLVGKGITFDSGGISIKPSSGMALMRGDMGGAACVLGCLKAVADLDLPVNLVVLVALAENMPSGNATKPGDVFTAMNGKTVEVDNTDAEGRLVLADALCYASEFNPSVVINAATLTGAIDVAIGAGATGTYSTCNDLWNTLQQAGGMTGDRMWRMPIYKYYTKQMQCSKTADLRNTQKKARSAGSPTAAAFLKEFVDTKSWAHLDIAGVMDDQGDVPYLSAGMSGRPTRTLVETVRMLAAEQLVDKFTK